MMVTPPPLVRHDALGRRLKKGDIVRVIAAPDLSAMDAAYVGLARAAFRHLIGTYRTIRGFDRYGFAEIIFRVRRGPVAGLHAVAIEPYLLRLKGMRLTSAHVRVSAVKERRMGKRRG